MSNQEVALIIVGCGPAEKALFLTGFASKAITAADTGCAATQDAQHYLSRVAPNAPVAEPVLEVSS